MASMDLLPTFPGDLRGFIDPYDELRRILPQLIAIHQCDPDSLPENAPSQLQEARCLEFIWATQHDPSTFGIMLPVRFYIYLSLFLLFS
jgi:hypothetical protein